MIGPYVLSFQVYLALPLQARDVLGNDAAGTALVAGLFVISGGGAIVGQPRITAVRPEVGCWWEPVDRARLDGRRVRTARNRSWMHSLPWIALAALGAPCACLVRVLDGAGHLRRASDTVSA